MTIKDLFRQIPATAYLYAVLAAALVTGFSVFVHQQREKGRQEVLTAQANASRDSLAKLIKHKDEKFRRDTVRIVRSIETIDTLIEHRVETALVHQTDTVKITIREATAIQDTLRACRSVLRDCAGIQSDLRGMLRADTAIIRSLRASQPGRLAPWRHRAEGAAVVLAVLKLAGIL